LTVFVSRLREETTACFFSQAAAIFFASSSVLTFFQIGGQIDPYDVDVEILFLLERGVLFPSRST